MFRQVPDSENSPPWVLRGDTTGSGGEFRRLMPHAGMRLSRHARNKARKLRIPWTEIRDALAEEVARRGPVGLDRRGNFEYEFRVREISIHAVVAADDPDWVITLWDRKVHDEG